MLDKIRKNRLQSSILMAAATYIAAIIIWPLFDLFWAKVISHNEFTYTAQSYLLEPIILAVVFGIVSYCIWKPETKIEKKAKTEKPDAK